MAELMGNKSSNVVSNSSKKKSNDVCSLNSNNSLSELDNTKSINNELIRRCDEADEDDDDLIQTKNTKNEVSAEDKSLQEMIESELALRICSANVEEESTSMEDDEEATRIKPEVTIKKIILEPRQDPLDVNAEFIIAEMEHNAIVEDPYTKRNGHSIPELKSNEKNEEAIAEKKVTRKIIKDDVKKCEESKDNSRSEDEIVEDEIHVESKSEPDCWSSPETLKFNKSNETALIISEEVNDGEMVTKRREEENETREAIDETKTWIHTENIENVNEEKNDLEVSDVWLDTISLEGNMETGEFSDDFDGVARRCENVGEEVENHDGLEMKSRVKLDETSIDENNENIVIENVNENSKVEGNIESNLEESYEIFEDDVIDVEPIVEEPESCEDSSQSQILPLNRHENISNVDNEISDESTISKNFVSEECKMLVKENVDERKFEEKREDAIEGDDEFMKKNDDCPGLKKDLDLFVDDVESYSSMKTLGIDEERVETECSWITVEEATNDRNKIDEKMNQRMTNDGSKEIIDENEMAKGNDDSVEVGMEINVNNENFINKTKNSIESVTDCENKMNFVGSVIDEDESCNSTKIDNSFLQDTTGNHLILTGNTVVAPLATPDDESSEFSNVCDSESRDELITSSTLVTSSTTTSTKSSTKTKKKKIEGVSGNDASTTLTPRTKKTKKSKKNDLEKENISVNINTEDPSMHTTSRQMSQEMENFLDEYDLSNVNVKSLTQSYVSETSRGEQEKSNKEVIETGVSIKQLCRSFGDISNMTDVDHVTYGFSEQTQTETHEKAKSMDDLRLCQRDFKKLARDATVFVGVSVKALRASYCSLANLTSEVDKEIHDEIQPNRFNLKKSSFNKFDALSKKTVIHVRSVDATKVQQQLNSVGQNGDSNSNCRSCGKVVFQMEQTKAEGLVWHKNCFRCVQCSKQLNVDNYQSHESTLYCKAHFKELFQPKPVEESDQPVRPRKPEMIIRENQPKELPPDVVRASDKPDLGLEELSSLNVKSRFQVFEKSSNDTTNEIERSPSQVVKRSPTILSKLAKFQAKGMDIGVADDSLNGIPYEESSESEEEEEIEESEELDTEIIKSKRTTREQPMSFTKMDDIKNRWECTSQQGRRESQREARKEEIAGIRSRLFMGKQGKMKEMYQQAVAESERVTKINPTEEIQHSTHARSIKERFERGEPIATSDGEDDSKIKQEKPDEEVIAAGISRKSRSLFLELDASAAKTGRPVTPVNPKTPTDLSRRARDAFMGRQVSDDVVRSTDTTEEVQVETSDISNKFKFFETYKEPAKERKKFRITPPRDGDAKQMGSPEREIYRDPDVVRADDRVDEVVHTDTARKMLSIFRQMEEKATKEDIPDGPKPLKRFTPPPEDKFAKATASDSEDEDEEEGEESEGEDSGEEKDPNYVRASDKVEDEFLKQAQNAARAKTLRAKFEHWETSDEKITSHHVAEMDMAQGNGDQASIESASSLRARFESLGSQPLDSPRAPKVKVNRFVEIQSICMDVCESCEKKVYPLEKVETNNKIFHKQCFRCLQCNCVLRMDTFTLNNGKLYCIPHFKQLFIARGNYDEGFGVDPHKNKWATNNTNSTNAASSAAISVSNGRATSVANRV